MNDSLYLGANVLLNLAAEYEKRELDELLSNFAYTKRLLSALILTYTVIR